MQAKSSPEQTQEHMLQDKTKYGIALDMVLFTDGSDLEIFPTCPPHNFFGNL